MDVRKIPPSRNPPDDINAVIEIPQGGVPVKYELDKVSGALFVNRFLHTAMYYPANYGFIPNILSEDRDPCDCMVLSQAPVAPSAVIRCRPIGARLMEDENGVDEKIIAVPFDELNPFYDDIGELIDLPPIFRDQIEHFFRHYKDLERGKWVKLTGWVDREKARAPAAGENVSTPMDFERLMAAEAVDFVQPSVARMGGISELCKMFPVAAVRNVTLMPHCF